MVYALSMSTHCLEKEIIQCVITTLWMLGTADTVSVFISRSAHSARTAGSKIALRFLRLFVCLCVRTFHVRNI